MQSRRKFLLNSLALGCSAAASPLITPVALANAPSDNRLVVIILRGAMDGLDVVRPLGDKAFASHRPDAAREGGLDLTGPFALHPRLGDLHRLWGQGELSFAHAVSTPYRDKRSHFDGQDMLEAGFGSLNETLDASGASGWLNRLLSLMPNTHLETAFAVGQEDMVLLRGDQPYSNWAPGRSLPLSPQGQAFLARLFENDPLFHSSADMAIDLSNEILGRDLAGADIGSDEASMMEMMGDNLRAANQASRAKALAEYTAEQLLDTTRIAAFSINGWDTHRAQSNAINAPLDELSTAIVTLKDKLGPIWNQTAVLCMTEFGRTVRLNGSAGTDHGTAGAMVMAGGAINGGQVFGQWPGLAEGDLYQDRDLLPTMDLREYAGHVMGGMFGLTRTQVTDVVFPGLDMMSNPKLLG